MNAPVRMLLPAIVLSAVSVLPAFGGLRPGAQAGPTASKGADRVKTANGIVESTVPPRDGVRSFKGLPFAAPPVGELRWREPQPVKNWTGARNADKFGPSCMQRLSANADYWLRGDGMSEDCLYLNVWTPARSSKEKLPVLVYIFGGGFQNGDGSEPRYDGETMARSGIVAVSLNYRTNVFGFFVHPELTRESPHHASGNYGLLDQVAALRWVRQNIAAFGGDPARVTIAGESAGSISVSALMASPLSKDLIAGAMCESGAAIASLPPQPLGDAEQNGVKFAAAAGADSLAALRRMTPQQLYDAAAGARIRFSTAMDGYFLSKTLTEIGAAGEQAKVPLLAGTNTEEQGTRMVLGGGEPTPENLANAIRKFYGDKADPVVKAYAATTTDEVFEAAMHLASARFISYGTWKWTELHMKTSGKPVYRYLYAKVRPAYLGMPGQTPPTAPAAVPAPQPAGGPAAPRGAVHSAEIQYAMGNLDLDKRYAWEPGDYQVSKTMHAYFVNFIKTGNPNGAGLPQWPAYRTDTGYQRMRIDVQSQAEPEAHRDRYLALDEALASSGGRAFAPATDLISLHYDHAPDKDDGQSAAADRTILQSIYSPEWIKAHVVAVSGAYGKNASQFNADSDRVMDAVWSEGGWLAAHANRERAVAEATRRWTAALKAGGDVWVKEGGQSDFTADVVRAIRAQSPEIDTTSRIHVVQHSDWNENQTTAAALDYTRKNTHYIRIRDANDYLNVKGGDAAFVAAALQHPAFAPFWKAAFAYYPPQERLDFSDTGELMRILGLGEIGIDAFRQKYLATASSRL